MDIEREHQLRRQAEAQCERMRKRWLAAEVRAELLASKLTHACETSAPADEISRPLRRETHAARTPDGRAHTFGAPISPILVHDIQPQAIEIFPTSVITVELSALDGRSDDHLCDDPDIWTREGIGESCDGGAL